MTKFLQAVVGHLYRGAHVRATLVLAAHLVPVPLSTYLAFWLRFDGAVPEEFQYRWLELLPVLIALRGLAFTAARLHHGLWRYASISDLKAIAGSVALSSLAFYFVVRWIFGVTYPRSVFILDALLLLLMLGGLRMARRIHRDVRRTQGKRVLIVGAGDAGELIVRDMKQNLDAFQPVGFIDDDPAKLGRRIHGVPVLGSRADLVRVFARWSIDEVLIAMPHSEPAATRSIVRALEPFKVPIKTLPRLRDIIDGRVQVGQIRSLAVEDLLARAPVGLDPLPVRNLIRNRRVMVTGAGGSIGSELCRQISKLSPSSLTLFERYENSLHAIRMELDDTKPFFKVEAVVGDVGDETCVNSTLRRVEPDIIFHAAAHKHVPLMEENPCEAIKNNVRGTRVLAQAAERCGVDRFILISTDKAVNPTSVMGASKRLAELVLQAQSSESGTLFSTVRFGNVLASNGSVVPRFIAQIKAGGPVTVTHPDMQRFFMLVPEAVQLVLHAAAQAETGATYVLEMGEQVKVVDMARDLIRLSGFVPDDEIAIAFTGLRPGEKLYEELVGPNEEVRPSRVQKILCVTSRSRPSSGLWMSIEQLENLAAAGDETGTLASMRRLIPEYEDPRKARTVPEIAGPADSPLSQPIVEQPCPRCGRQLIRSRAKTLVEQFRKELTARRPFRCGPCGWRGWLFPIHIMGYSTDGPASPPDLSSIDRPPRPPRPSRPGFSPKHLQ